MDYSKAEEHFLETLQETIDKNLEDANLDVEKLASTLNITRITLYRKIKAIFNLTPIELITVTRLKKAAALLAQGHYRVYEVADMVDLTSQSNFARGFHKQFGMSPTDYVHENRKKKGSSVNRSAFSRKNPLNWY
jgi:two-component system, cell cycle response regulator